MIQVTRLSGKQRNPRFVMNSGRGSATEVLEMIDGAGDITGNDELATVQIGSVRYTARKVG